MTEHTPDIPLGSWLAELPDERLIRLLELRPDLAQPAPGSIAALAMRAQARQSVRAATDELDFLRLALIDALLVLHADSAPVPLAKLVALIGDRAPESDVAGALDDLKERALVWGDTEVRVAGDAGTALPWYPGQAILEDDGHSKERIVELLDDLDDDELLVLNRLLDSSPVGRTRDAEPGALSDRPVPRLLAKGLLRRIDAETVILPRQVGHLLRGEDPGPVQLRPPDPATVTTTPGDVDAAAAGAVIDLLHELGVMLETLSAAPVPELRSGGLGVREVKRLAKVTGIDEARLGLILELAAAAGLIAGGTPDPLPNDADGPHWAPTVAADRFAETSTADRWHLLASTWLDLPRRPALIGTRGPDDKPYGALSDSVYSTAAPLDRRLALGMLAELPPGTGVDQTTASAALVWRRPRWVKRLQPERVADLMNEAHCVGLVGRGAISTAGRALLEQDLEQGDAAVIDAMTRALPTPIDHFLVQADLTVVAPGPLERRLADELNAVATVESAGAAMVYRVSEQSIRHALDIGKTADALRNLFERHSKTPVPQALTYLIDDVARRHGQLRIGMAASFVRCEDPALLAQAVAAGEPQGLRILAPTVAVSQAPIAEVLAALRGAGFAPAAEDSAGTIVDIRARGARVPAPPQQRRPHRPIPRPGSDTLSAVVAVLRKVSSGPFASIRVDPAVAMSLLQRAARDGITVVIGYVDPAGVATQRVVTPIAVVGGQLMAFDSTSGRARDFAIHRISSVVPADDAQERSR